MPLPELGVIGSNPYSAHSTVISGMAYPALEHPRLSGYACGPRHWLQRPRKKSPLLRGAVAPLPRLFLIFPFFQRRPNWLYQSCNCVLNPLDQERRALVLECHE